MRPWGEPPWHRTKVPVRPIESSRPEVAVIGGGFTAIATAWHLARRGIHTVVLEAESLGEGASGRTGGLVLEGTAWGIMDRADRCIAALAEAVSEARLECYLKLPGCWEIAHTDGDSKNMLPWQDGGRGIRIVRTVAGGTVDPMALLTQLAAAAVVAGATVHEHARVRRLVFKPSPAIEIEGAVVRPHFVVVAVNAWTSELLPEIRPTQSALTFACATEPLDESALESIGLAGAIPFYTVDTPYLWGRQTQDHRVIFGAGLTYDSPSRLEEIGLDSADPSLAIARLESRIRSLHPALADVRISHRWAGPIAIPRGGIPLIGSLPHAPSVLVAGGYAGHGVALSFCMARMLARAIADREPLPAWGKV